MSDQIGINLKKEVGIVLTKRKLNNLRVQVAVIFDVSGSTRRLVEGGVVQTTLKRVFAIADKVDDNHTLDAWIFADQTTAVPGVTPENVDSYIREQILYSPDPAIKATLWQGTYYAPPIEALVEYYKVETQRIVAQKATGIIGSLKSMFGVPSKVVIQTGMKSVLEDEEMPAFAMVFTDGDNNDKGATTKLIKEYEDSTVFLMFVGIGQEQFKYLRELAGSYKNVDFTDISDLDGITSEAMYEKLISQKFAGWVKNVAPHCITN